MPSATASTRLLVRNESWLSERTRPTSGADPHRSCISRSYPSADLEHRVADLEAVALVHHHRPRDLAPVEVGAVRRTEVFDEELPLTGEHPRVQLRDVGVV